MPWGLHLTSEDKTPRIVHSTLDIIEQRNENSTSKLIFLSNNGK